MYKPPVITITLPKRSPTSFAGSKSLKPCISKVRLEGGLMRISLFPQTKDYFICTDFHRWELQRTKK
jgi:hypothetical protein